MPSKKYKTGGDKVTVYVAEKWFSLPTEERGTRDIGAVSVREQVQDLYSRVLLETYKDCCIGNAGDKRDALMFVSSPCFVQACRLAKVPVEVARIAATAEATKELFYKGRKRSEG